MPALTSASPRPSSTIGLGNQRGGNATPAPAAEVQRLLTAQQRLLFDLKRGALHPDGIVNRVAMFPELSREASALLWTDPANRKATVSFARELALIVPNAVMLRRGAYPVTARENYGQAVIMYSRMRRDEAGTAEHAARFAKHFPTSPMAPWARRLAGDGF